MTNASRRFVEQTYMQGFIDKIVSVNENIFDIDDVYVDVNMTGRVMKYHYDGINGLHRFLIDFGGEFLEKNVRLMNCDFVNPENSRRELNAVEAGVWEDQQWIYFDPTYAEQQPLTVIA